MTDSSRPDDWIDTENTPERRILDLRQIGLRHALTLGKLRYQHASKPLESQRHDHWLVVVFLFSGMQRYWIDDREVSLRGGEMLRILPGQTYSTGTLPEQRGELAWLILNPPSKPVATLGMSREGAFRVFARLLESGDRVSPMPAEVPGLVDELFECWDDRDDSVVRERINNRLAAMILSMIANEERDKEGKKSNAARVRRVLDWLDVNHGDIPDVETMARHAGLSQALFHRYFKEITGCTPHDYELRLKVDRAAEVLEATPKVSVTHLAHDLGFSSSQYFATVFKRYHGVSPTVFRGAGRGRHE